MTIEKLLSQMGMSKQLTERYAEYPAAAHEQQLYYTYEPPASYHTHVATSKHHYGGSGGGGHKSNAAMSALTLLAFLFFLHILQQCIKDHMTAMSNPQIMIMTAGREGEENIMKMSNSNKFDKTGITSEENEIQSITNPTNKKDIIEPNQNHGDVNHYDEHLMKINIEEHIPQRQPEYKSINKNNKNKPIISEFVNAMDET